jgi:SpoVK/Ycf46/Vps4 family AAA+-type ATPase
MMPSDPLTWQHLQIELTRIDLLIQRQVWLWTLAGQDPGDSFRGLKVSAEEVAGLLARPIGSNWGQTAAADPEQWQHFETALAEATHQAEALVSEAARSGQTPRLQALAEAFGLDRFDLDILLLCLAPAIDLRYERLYGFLQDDVTRKRPSVDLVLNVLCPPGLGRLARLGHFATQAPLFHHQLIEKIAEAGAASSLLLSQTLQLDETLLAWLLGNYWPRPELTRHLTLTWPQATERDTVLAAAALAEVEQALGRQTAPPICIFYGPDRAAQLATARLIAARRQRPLLTADLAAASSDDLPAPRALALILRDARLTGAVPLVVGWEAGTSADAPRAELFATLCDAPGLVMVAGQAAGQVHGVDRQRTIVRVDFPIPTYHQRQELWQHYLGSTLAKEDQEIVATLASQFLLTSEQVRDAVASARDLAAQQGEPLNHPQLLAAARLHSNPNLSNLARKITPRYTWTDIILPPDPRAILQELVGTVRNRPHVLEDWGVGKKLASSAGITALFAGDPGTGKTMAAEVIAGELGLDLYKIDLSTIVSKYIGETEKNLERIFGEAQSSNAILFFDEADAIFGKRSEVKDAHDRYANIEISYLLQRMEAYDGVTILATNLRANLDEAFARRLQFAVDFPFPDDEHRQRIWQALFPAAVPRAADLDFGLLARRFKLAGGNIRNIIVTATYLAAADGAAHGGGEVGMRHLLHGARRELQKMGRLVNEKDLSLPAPQDRP